MPKTEVEASAVGASDAHCHETPSPTATNSFQWLHRAISLSLCSPVLDKRAARQVRPTTKSMAIDASAEKIDPWAFMAPWCEALHGRLRLRCGVQYMRRTPSNDKRWELHVALASSPKDDSVQNGIAASSFDVIAEMREALELLSLIAAVDNEAWRRLLATCVIVERREGDQPVPGECFSLPPFRFRLDERDADFAELARLLKCFFIESEQHSTSTKFQADRRRILAFGSELCRGSDPDVLEHHLLTVPFSLELFPTSSGTNGNLLTSLGSIFRTADALSRSQLHPKNANKCKDGFFTTFKLVSRALFAGAVSIEPSLAVALVGSSSEDKDPADHAEDVFPDSNLAGWSVSLDADVQLPMALAGRFFHRLGTGRASTKRMMQLYDDDTSTSGIFQSATDRTLSFMFDTASSWKFQCAISALLIAQGVNTVTLDGMFETPNLALSVQRLKWQWLAFALFSKASTGSSIKAVVLDDLQISPSDVDAIAAVLQSNQPEPRVIATHAPADLTAADHLDYVRLRPNALVSMCAPPRMNESGGSNQQSTDRHPEQFSIQLECEDDGDWFQVLDDAELSPDLVSILVPGYGKCVSLRSSIIDTRRRGNRPAVKGGQANSPRGGVTALSLSFLHEIDASILPRLLQLVGHSLEYLSIANIGSRRWHQHRTSTEEGVDLAWLAHACPNLRHLRLADSHIQLDSLIAAGEVCKLRNLELHRCHVTSGGIHRFTEALGDADTPLAMHLAELSLHCCDENRRGLDQASAEVLEIMLASNSKLQFLRVWLPHQLSVIHRPRLEAFDDQPLAVAREHLPLSCKLAVLGCIYPHHQPADATANVISKIEPASRLHEDVLRGIFALAATCEARRVQVLDL